MAPDLSECTPGRPHGKPGPSVGVIPALTVNSLAVLWPPAAATRQQKKKIVRKSNIKAGGNELNTLS